MGRAGQVIAEPLMPLKEFLLVMAINIEQAKSLPEGTSGLCGVGVKAITAGLITLEDARLYGRLLVRCRPKSRHTVYYWRPGIWRPRVLALRKMAAML